MEDTLQQPAKKSSKAVNELCTNTIRMLCADAVPAFI